MGFGLYDLFLSSLFVLNALSVIHEKRFLAKHGWDKPDPNELNKSMKARFVNVLYSSRNLLQIPLILINTIAIIFLFIFG